ncbi:hypothetical protein PVAG01_02558 [Phlyctema vagabunda]|uniref:SUN domain-containing protein n=1 Tax=Phlyctema vagabunda TaxID=108571 RepID=A0ABR4PRJ1_9HELO
MDEIIYPSSIQEVESLVLQLYQPGPPQKLVKIQETLQTLQRSSEGWQLANRLLENPNEQIRFFGALTFIVKLNTDYQSLSEDDASSLLVTLLERLLQALDTPGGPLIVKKLCSVLVAYFMHFSATWTNCIKHVLYCLCTSQALPYNALENAPDTTILVKNISVERALAVLWFSTALVEEVAKTDSNSMKHNHFHQRLQPNVSDVVDLIQYYLPGGAGEKNTNSKLSQESMKCFQSWVLYSHRAFVDAEIVFDPLRSMTKQAMACILHEDLYEITIELFTDVLSNYSRFLTDEELKNLYSLLASPWAQERYEKLVKGDFDFESLQFGMFLLAFGDATVQDLIQNVESSDNSRLILSNLAGLTGAAGYAVSEDKIFDTAVNFWATFVETMIDYSYSENTQSLPWVPTALSYLMRAIENSWHKIQFPPQDIFNSWDSTERIAFKDIRRDVADLLQQSYTQYGSSLMSMFVDTTLRSVQSESWAELEASIYCLNAFADGVSSDEKVCDELLGKVFGSPIFVLFTDPDKDMPPRVRQTFLSLIANYSDYFERNTGYLPGALDLLFKTVEALPRLASSASASIYSLCASCRTVLVPEVESFLLQYSRFAHNSQISGLAKERIIGAIASIIQAIPQDAIKLSALEQLTKFIETDVEQCILFLSSQPGKPGSTSSGQAAQENLYELALSTMADSLRCLASVAKGMQVPNDVPVDLEDDNTASSFWSSGPGSELQQRLMNIISKALATFPNQGEIVEAVCNIFRAGFTEHEPGPFVFPAAHVTRVLLDTNMQTPQLGLAISTASCLVNTRKSNVNELMNVVVRELLGWVSQLLQNVTDPSNDTEIAQNGIDFIKGLIPSYLDIFVKYEPSSVVEYLLMFTLKALTGKDFLPKIAAAEFWSSLVSFTPEDDSTKASLQNILQYLGPLLAKALIYNFGSHAARSELDRLVDPLRKLVVGQVRSKSWLEAALMADDFPNSTVTTSERRVFLQKIINLRGVLLFSAQPSRTNASTITTSAPSATQRDPAPTCEARTINYITDSLPQLCLKSSWRSKNSSTYATQAPAKDAVTSHEGPVANLTISTATPSIGSSLDEAETKAVDDSSSVHPSTLSESATSTSSSPPTEPSDAELGKESEGELNDASFLSFEDWKKQTLEKAGQQNSNIGNRKSGGPENKKRDSENVQNNFDSLGDEGEIDLDFGAFRNKEDVQQSKETPKQDSEDDSSGRSSTRRKEQYRSKDAGKTCKERFSYSSFDAGATILKTHKGAKHPKAVLVENKDSYMLSECAAENKFLIVELSEDIWIDTLVLANYEFFSSMFRTFRVSVSDRYPVKHWHDLGILEARNSREIQPFLIENPMIWARYLRLEFLSHYGNEYYCPLSLIRVHGTRMIESWKEEERAEEEDEDEEEEEAQNHDDHGRATSGHSDTGSNSQTAELREVQAAIEELVKTAGAIVPDHAEQKIDSTQLINASHALEQESSSESGGTSPLRNHSMTLFNPNYEAVYFCRLAENVNATAKWPGSDNVIDASNKHPIPMQSIGTDTAAHSQSNSGANSHTASPHASVSVSPDIHSTTKSGTTSSESIPTTGSTVVGIGKVDNATSSQKQKGSGTSSASASLPTIQESFFKAVSRRLQLLEANSTLSLKYIEEQSKILREAFSKVEKKQHQKSSAFLENLNNTVLAELRGFRQQYDEIWQSTVISLESQKEESQREILAISARLNILADELVFQKRMSIVQACLLLLCLGLVIFSRVSGAGQLDFAGGQFRANFLRSPLGSPLNSPEYRRVQSLRGERSWSGAQHRRNRSDDSVASRSPSGDDSPPTPISAYSRSENEIYPDNGIDERREDSVDVPSSPYEFSAAAKSPPEGFQSWDDREDLKFVVGEAQHSSPAQNRIPVSRSEMLSSRVTPPFEPTEPDTQHERSENEENYLPVRTFSSPLLNESWPLRDLPGSPSERLQPLPSPPPEPHSGQRSRGFSIARKPLPALPTNGT